jgi:hypothetical protein
MMRSLLQGEVQISSRETKNKTQENSFFRDLSNWFRNVGESPFHRRGKTQNGSVMTLDHVLSRLQVG